MSDRVKCTWFSKTTKVRRYLRRFEWSTQATPCKHGRPHEALTVFDEIVPELDAHGYLPDYHNEQPGPEDPRWLTRCTCCGKSFSEDAQYQLVPKWLYQNQSADQIVDEDELYNIVGALFYTSHSMDFGSKHWKAKHFDSRYPHLIVITPAGSVDLDMESRGGGPGWSWSGHPPCITAHPSLLLTESGKETWHGWLHSGELIPC